MPSGRVKWFSLEKGFGFISNDEGEDVYLSADAVSYTHLTLPTID
jgi:CspA family cold shock protein